MPTVLIVDDDEGVRKLVEMILQQKGYDTLSARNGLEGLMVYSSYRQRVDLVLTDVDMPEMNGIELASRIRSRDPSKSILLMSGRAPDDFKDAEFPMVAKPFGAAQLVKAVSGALTAA